MAMTEMNYDIKSFDADLLWTNPLSSSSFAAQDLVKAEFGNYNHVIIEFIMSSSLTTAVSRLLLAKTDDTSMGGGTSSSGARARGAYFTNGTTIHFTDAYVESTVNNARVLPYRIYGINVSLT